MKKFFNTKTFALALLSLLICAVMCISASADYKITSDPTGLTLENDNVIMAFDTKGAVKEYTYKGNGMNYLGSKSHFAIITTTLNEYYVSELRVNSIDENVVNVTAVFDASGLELDFDITVENDYIIFELLEEIPKGYDKLSMCVIKLSSAYTGKEFATFSVSLDINTKMDYYPSRYDLRSLTCYAYQEYGNAGLNAKFATVGCPTEKYYDVLRFIAEFVADYNRVPVTNMGGPYAKTEEVMDIAVQDYVILSSNPTDEAIRFWLSYNATQFDFHQSAGNSFAQGNMEFAAGMGGSAEAFKENVSDRIKKIAKEEYGLDAIMGLHTYAYYIDTRNKSLLSSPETVRQLEYFEDEIYTVSAAINKTQTNIPVFEDNSNFQLETGFFVYNSKYIRVDDELMLVSKVDGDEFHVSRAQCGTIAANHRKGASVYHLTGLFGMLAPQLESQLFIDIAHYTAEAYVKGGFGMIYIDALDGIGRHTDQSWYYCGLFVKEIVREINRYRETYPEYADTPDPIFEYSTMATSIWGVRTRTGAMDTVCRGIKDFISYHTRSNATNTMNYTTNIGWYALYNGDMGFMAHLQTWDDVDLLGKNIIAHNMGYSYNNFSLSSRDNLLHMANADLLVKYLRLRDEGYFTKEVIDTISGYRDEWALIEKNGEYGFEHRDYNEIKFNALSDVKKANNPFEAQVPKVIRIQSMLTDEKTEYITVADFDEKAPITNITNIKGSSGGHQIELAKTVNLSTYKAMVVRVYGNGLGGKLNIMIDTEDAKLSRTIEMDFVGWRDVVLADVDNGINDQEFYSSGGYNFNRNTNYVAEMVTLKVSGNMEGVLLDTVKLAKHTFSSVTNPGISYNGSSIVFNTTLTGLDYIEFDGTNAIHYNLIAEEGIKIGQATPIEFTKTGNLTAPKGEFVVTMLGEGSEFVDRHWLTLGFAGEQIFNDLSNEAVESIVVKTLPKKTSYTVGQSLDTTGLSIYELMNTGRTRDVEGGWTVAPVTFTESGIQYIPVTYNGYTTTFAVVVHDIVPTQLEISKPANKTSFYVGENLDTTGLELKLTYNNDTTETVTTGYTVSIDKIAEAGTSTVVITYKEFTVSYDIVATVPSLHSITVTRLPNKTVYEAGEMFSTVGMVVTGNYSAGITAEITDYTFTPSGALTVGTTEVVISKNGYTTTCPITVAAPATTADFTLSAADTVAVPGADFEVVVKVNSNGLFEGIEYELEYVPHLAFNGVSATNIPEGWELWVTPVDDHGIPKVRVALIDENDVPVPATAEQLALSFNFTATNVTSGEILIFDIRNAYATDDTFSYIEGENAIIEVIADTKIVLTAESDYKIDRENGFVYITAASTNAETFYSNFACNVSVETSSAGLVRAGDKVTLESDGVVVDTLTVILIGDVNKNGRIDSNDYSRIKNAFLGKTTLDSTIFVVADVNKNGIIDTSDYMLVKKSVEGAVDIFDNIK